jgi:small-conductance mechanosensitive channel
VTDDMILATILAQSASDVADACGDAPAVVCEWVFDATGNATLARFVEWVVAKPLTVVLIFVGAFIINRIIDRSIDRFIDRLIEQREKKEEDRSAEEVEGRFDAFRERAIEKTQFLAVQRERSTQRARALGTVLHSITSLIVYGIAFMIILGELGISLGPMIAGAGIAGAALGFGAQSLVKDFLSGFFMLAEDQYGIGDVIDVGDTVTGVVEEVNLRTTRLRDYEGTVWHVPNGEIRRVGNKSQQWARTVLDIEVAYDTDLHEASRVIERVALDVFEAQIPNATVLETPEIWGVQTLGASGIAIRVGLKTEPGEQWATAREMRRRIKEAFDEAGIEIPFPQRTIWMHEVEAPPSPAPPSQSSSPKTSDEEESPLEREPTPHPEGED